MAEQTISITRDEIEPRLAWITLDRPDRNMLHAEMTDALFRALVEADEDDSIGAIALIGAGEAFCGGADGAHLRASGTAREFADAAVNLFGYFPRAKTPILAALNGDALAGGFGLACSADIVVSVPDARLGTIEASLGTWPTIAQTAAIRRVPPKAAITNIVTGVPFNAERALQLGVIDEIVEPEALGERVRELALLTLTAGAAGALGRPLLYASYDLPFEQALRQGAEAFVSLFAP